VGSLERAEGPPEQLIQLHRPGTRSASEATAWRIKNQEPVIVITSRVRPVSTAGPAEWGSIVVGSLENTGPKREKALQKIQSDLTRAESLNVDIEERIKDLNPQIEVASWLRPIIDGASGPTVVISAEYREGLEKSISKLPFAERGLYALVGRDPEGQVDLVGLKNFYDSNRGDFAEGIASGLKAFAKRDRYLHDGGGLLGRLSEEEAGPFRIQLEEQRGVVEQQADKWPVQTRWPRGEETTDSAVGFVAEIVAAGSASFEWPIRFLDALLIRDDPTDIEIYLFDPPLKFK
jgi:hypothetical protein